ncbi:unnamed protein product [Eruca vesicaria subsp. sativa]|uniref:Uncharacterized protein n=1 Tax=Eruca vesicaria subsp. sativa TaxID=29727 RepID=A0ABC8KEN8_ERUVS|nr:unnamed protein product [Eruca vesicaria subsp. sativa]
MAIRDDEIQNLTDGDVEETDILQDEFIVEPDDITQAEETGVKSVTIGEEDKKKGARKVLFRQWVMVGTSRKKFVQAVLSPCKRTNAKTGTSQGDGTKQVEAKGPSNPKPSSTKQ